MTQKFTDPRLVSLNDDTGFIDSGMRRALCDALEPGEVAIAAYSVSAHIWAEAVLTDRALLIVKGAVRARVTRVPLPLDVTRTPGGSRQGVRVRTPRGKKTLWGSKLDAEARLLLDAAQRARTVTAPAPSLEPAPATSPGADDPVQGARATRRARRQARRAAGPRPRRPRRRRVPKPRVGSAPPSTIWEIAYNCVKCGRPLTDPRSRQARVGTKCIRIYGSQQRRIPNPAHAAWIDKKTKADVAYIADKTRADADYARARTAYEEARGVWMRARSAR